MVNYIKQNHHRFHFFVVLIIATAISFGFYLSTTLSIKAQVSTKRLIQPSDLTYQGMYRLPSVVGLGGGIGLAYRQSTDTFFMLNGGLIEVKLPSTPPSTTGATAPQATLVKDYGKIFDPYLGPQIGLNSIMWDEANKVLWVSYGKYYGQTATDPNLIRVDMSSGTPVTSGPWTSSIDMRRTWSQCIIAPASLQAITNKAFVCTGMRGSTSTKDSYGPNLNAEAMPTLSTPVGSALPVQELMFWPMIGDFSQIAPNGQNFKIYYSNYPKRDTYTITQGFGPPTPYNEQPYYQISWPALWSQIDDSGQFVWIDDVDLQGILFFGVYGMGNYWYGNGDENANITLSQQLIPSIAYPQSVNPLGNGYIYDQSGDNSRGTHMERRVPAIWFIDPQQILNSAQGLRDSKITHYNFVVPTEQWSNYQINNSIVPVSQVGTANHRPGVFGVYYNSTSKKLYVTTFHSAASLLPGIQVFDVNSSGSTPTPIPTPTGTVTPTPPVDRAPLGQLDSVDCSFITGWTFDQDTSNISINTEIYRDGAKGAGGVLIASGLTNVSRPTINSTYGITGNHGFNYSTPASLKDGVTHSIYTYGINSNSSGSDTLLLASPTNLNCPVSTLTPTPTPTQSISPTPTPTTSITPGPQSSPTPSTSISPPGPQAVPAIPPGVDIKIQDLLSYSESIGGFLMILGGILAVIAIIVSGIMYFVSGGGTQGIATAKGMLKAGIIGALVLFGVGIIISTVKNFAADPLQFFR